MRLRPDMYPGYEVINGKLEEGFQLQVSPLLSADARVCDVAVKCHNDQVEKMVPLNIDVPAAAACKACRFKRAGRQLASQGALSVAVGPSQLLSCGIV